MKKLILLAMAGLLLVGCTSTKPKYTSDVAYYKIGDKTVSESDYYDLFIENDRAMSIYTDILEQINEDSDAQEKYKKEIQDIVDKEVATLKETFGENLDAMIQNVGFKSLDEFLDLQLRPSIALQFEMEDYISDNLESIVSEYKVKDISLFSTDDKAFAEDISNQLIDGKEASDIKIEKKATLKETLFTKSLDTGSEVANKELLKLTEDASPITVYDEEAKLYYVIKVNNSDFSKDVESLLQVLAENENYTEVYTAMQFGEVNAKVYDARVKKLFNELKPGYVK